jgi:hypothetical protein
VGFGDFFRARPGRAPDPPLRLRFEEHAYETESEKGEPLDGYGYALRDENDRAVTWDEPLLAASGIEVVKVAGTSHRSADLQNEAFAPGSRLFGPTPTTSTTGTRSGCGTRAAKSRSGSSRARRRPISLAVSAARN